MAYRDNWGGKTGSGAVASEDVLNVARRARLRELTMEVVDLKKDPYFMRNHLGSYECKLCLTLHSNEGNYLAHTQGRRHQANLARRAAREEKYARVAAPVKKTLGGQSTRMPRIGRPAYRVTKQRDPISKQLSLLFQVLYPHVASSHEPRHRFMSAFEQKLHPPDARYQYLLIAAAPYETIAFRIPNARIDRAEGRYYSYWDREARVYVLQLFFLKPINGEAEKSQDIIPGAAERESKQFESPSATAARSSRPV
mmetsp:Transcript_776/g.2096  ORF Transcript_776/g.2096 Transcript_776/m.2096 type:complete len:254 (-) Transcript_776:1028-1789(-)